MARTYIKARKYKVKEDKIKTALEYAETHHKGYTKNVLVRFITDGKSLTFKRWLYYFDYDFLLDILIDEELLEMNKKLEQAKELVQEGEQIN